MKIGIIGFGVVGKAAAKTFSKAYEVIKYDKYFNYDKFESLLTCEFVFIMVPTPFDCEKNEVDLSAIDESLQRLGDLGFSNTAVIKSTVPLGTCDNYSIKFDFNIVFNPEFLRESITPDEDFANQDTIVIGTSSDYLYSDVKKLYERVAVDNAKYYQTTFKEAEMIKCSQNTMLASRVSLANMIYEACNKHSIDYNIIREIAFDNFEIIGRHMVQVPGPDGSVGFGGKCLPKDIRAFSTFYTSPLLSEIIRYNDSLREDLGSVLKNYNSKRDKR